MQKTVNGQRIRKNTNKQTRRVRTSQPQRNQFKPIVFRMGDREFMVVKNRYKYRLLETFKDEIGKVYKDILKEGNYKDMEGYFNAFHTDLPDGFVRKVNRNLFRYRDWRDIYPRNLVKGVYVGQAVHSFK